MSDITIAGATFSDVTKIQIPKSGSGTAEFVEVSGSQEITQNDTYDVSALAQVVVNVSGGGGGGGTSVPEKDVNFYDYDGTCVAAYTATEFASLSEMPTNPSHNGLTAQGWNWSLADAKTYVASYGCLQIGQQYITNDDKTRLYLEIPSNTPDGRKTVAVRFSQTVANGVTINWGDGSADETYSGTNNVVASHTYSNPGSYTISLKATSGSMSFVGSSSATIMGDNEKSGINCCRIKKVEIGKNVTSLGNYVFHYCSNLETITIPKAAITIGTYAFDYCNALKALVLPDGATTIGSSAFLSCANLKMISLPKSVTSLGDTAFAALMALERLTIPAGITLTKASLLNTAFNLKRISIPEGLTTIGASSFTELKSIYEITLPASLTTLGNNVFTKCYSLINVHVKATTPPTRGINCFINGSSDLKIYVPYSEDHSVLAAYQTDWSNLASKLVEESA